MATTQRHECTDAEPVSGVEWWPSATAECTEWPVRLDQNFLYMKGPQQESRSSGPQKGLEWAALLAKYYFATARTKLNLELQTVTF